MVEFVLNIGSKDGKSYKKELSDSESSNFLGMKIGSNVSGDPIGFKGYTFSITGGSDSNGFPIRADIIPGTRKKPLVVQGTGAKLKEKGTKQRKSVRGNLIDDNIRQINLKVEKESVTPLSEIFGKSSEVDDKNTKEEKTPKKDEVKKLEETKGTEKELEKENKDEGKNTEEKK